MMICNHNDGTPLFAGITVKAVCKETALFAGKARPLTKRAKCRRGEQYCFPRLRA